MHFCLRMTTQLLGARILALLGLSAVAQSAGCSSVDVDGGTCGQAHDEEPIPGCTVTIDPGDELTEKCALVAPIDGGCPPIEVMNADDVLNGTAVCGPIPGGAGDGGGGVAGGMGGAVGEAGGSGGGIGGAGGGVGGGAQLECCYPVVLEMLCPGGRPFLVDGQARTAAAGSTGSGWQGDHAALLISDLSEAVRRRIAAEWARDGHMEHASVAAFAKFALELMALGAPFDLVRDTQLAMADEIRHARRCFDLAALYGESGVVLGPLDFGVIRADASLASVVRSTIVEGCVGETVAATMAAHASITTREPATAAVLAEIAEDESRHAELAWRFVAWALARDPSLHSVVKSAFDHAIAKLVRGAEGAVDADEHTPHLSAHGRLSSARKQRAILAAVSEVISPCSRALLAREASAVEAPSEQAVC